MRQWRRQPTEVGGKVEKRFVRGLGDGGPPAGSRGGARLGRSGGRSPQKLKHFIKFHDNSDVHFTMKKCSTLRLGSCR